MNKKITGVALCLIISMILLTQNITPHGGGWGRGRWGGGWGYGVGLGLGFGYPGWGGYGAYPGWGAPYAYNPYYNPNYYQSSRYSQADIDRNREREQYYRGRADAAKELTRTIEKQQQPKNSRLAAPISPERSKPRYENEQE